VCQLGCYDFSGNGKSDLMIARDNATVEICRFDINDTLQL